jgi:soluble lytic murein transglycosylase-like protein
MLLYMKKWGATIVTMAIVVSLLTVILSQEITNHKATMKMQEALVGYNELKEENEQLLLENKVLIIERDRATMTGYINEQIADKETFKLNGYLAWMEAAQLSEQFTEDSNGKFKKEWGLFLVKEATKYGVNPYLVYELIKVESGHTFNPKLVGPKTKYGHAYGMTQFMKNTAPWIAKMADLPYEHEKLFDPYYSIQLSIVYLDFLYKRYNNWDKALTAYNRGIYGLENYIQKNGHAKSSYAVKIQNGAEKHKYVALSTN